MSFDEYNNGLNNNHNNPNSKISVVQKIAEFLQNPNVSDKQKRDIIEHYNNNLTPEEQQYLKDNVDITIDDVIPKMSKPTWETIKNFIKENMTPSKVQTLEEAAKDPVEGDLYIVEDDVKSK
jgi:hypothetical protein